ncbi:MAG: hypothetical protein AAF602_07720 [Myxococcota bacterium]
MHAVVREVPDSFVSALAETPRRISLTKARRQHARYVEALRAAGAEVIAIPADEAHPDCPFVEDQAVVLGSRALIARAGHPSRQGEAGPVAAVLAERGLELVPMPEPATLDGGDVLLVGGTLYVGRSRRTNGEGIAALARTFDVPVVPVPVAGLHLKSVASAASDRLVLVAAGTVDPALFDGCDVVVVPPDEAAAANVVAVGRTVLLLAGHPVTREALEDRRLDVVELGASEFRKADGSLTCLSILVATE